SEYESYVMQLYHGLSFEVTNAEKPYLDKFGADHGVRIARTLSHEMQIPRDQFIIVGIDGQKVNSVSDVRALMKDKGPNAQTRITFQARNGKRETVVF